MRAVRCSRLRLLTERQLQVLAILSEGHGRKGTAELLGLKPGSIHSHVGRILLRLKANNITHAAGMIARCQKEAETDAS